MLNFFKSRAFKILAAVIVIICFGMIVAAANGYGASAQSTIVGTIFSPVQKLSTYVSEKLNIAGGNASGRTSYEKEIAELENEIGDLQKQLVDFENIKRQNQLYKEFLELKDERTDFEFAECSVIARDSADLFYSFNLDKGTKDGIKINAPVIYGKYLVGVVIKVYPNYSVVRTVLDGKFNASVYEIVSQETGYINGSLDLAKNGLCKLSGLSSTTPVTEGSLICTNGVGGVFPKDLIIGTVDDIKNEEIDISSYAVVKPGVDVRTLTNVFVITAFDGQGVEK